MSKVHLYVSAKLALGDPEASDGAAVVHRELVRAMTAVDSLREGDGQAVLDVVHGEAGLEVDGAAIDVVELARALWELRGQGRDQVRRWGDEDVPPILPTLLVLRGGERQELFDRENEHAMLLLVYFLARFHPRSPVPIPDELLLYEGYVTDVDAVRPGIVPAVRAIRAYLYAMHAYCDLAAADGRGLDALSESATREAVASAMAGIGVETDDAGADAGSAALGALAHVSTASCYLQRDDRESADEELRRFCDAAERAGAPPEDLALLRVYLAMRGDDVAEARRQLELARAREGIGDREREELDRLHGHLEEDDRSFVDAYFDRAFFAGWALHYTLARLEEAGVLEGLAEAPLYRSATSMLVAVLATLQAAQRAIPSFESVREQGLDWFGR